MSAIAPKDIDPKALQRALRRLIDRRKRLFDAFEEQAKFHIQYVDGEGLAAAFADLTPAQHTLIEIALETGFKLGAPPGAMRGDFVFIAHASEDAEIARRIKAVLGEHGIRSFVSGVDLTPGDWNEKILEALDECAAMIVLISHSAAKKSYVKSEVQAAFEGRKAVIPIRLETPGPRPELIDNRLRTAQIFDWNDEVGLDVILPSLSFLASKEAMK